MRKILLLVVALGLVGAIVAAHAQTTTNTTGTPVLATSGKITPNQILAAGFTEPTAVATKGTRFQSPNQYFKVKETVAKELNWGDISNLVAVLITPKNTADWQYNTDQIELRTFDGRTQARVTSATNYIVVTGPDQTKVTKLAEMLKNAY